MRRRESGKEEDVRERRGERAPCSSTPPHCPIGNFTLSQFVLGPFSRSLTLPAEPHAMLGHFRRFAGYSHASLGDFCYKYLNTCRSRYIGDSDRNRRYSWRVFQYSISRFAEESIQKKTIMLSTLTVCKGCFKVV